MHINDGFEVWPPMYLRIFWWKIEVNTAILRAFIWHICTQMHLKFKVGDCSMACGMAIGVWESGNTGHVSQQSAKSNLSIFIYNLKSGKYLEG